MDQPAHFSAVAFCCIQKGVCEMPVGGLGLMAQYRHDQSRLSTGHGIGVLV